MKHFEDFRAAAAARFNTQFSAAYPSIPIQWENLPFEQPNNQIYVSFILDDADGGEAEIGKGTKVERYSGQLRIQVHVPEDQGTKEGNEVIQDASRIFIRQSLSGTDWTAKFTRRARTRMVTQGDWRVQVIDISYERDERNSD